MPFFRPERALSQLLRHHHDAFSPFLSRPSFHSPLSLSRLFDPHPHASPLCAPFFTVFEDARLKHQQQHTPADKADVSQSNQGSAASPASSSSADPQEGRVVRHERSEEWMERKRRHHRGLRHQHPLSLWSPFSSSPFPSLFNSFAHPFAPLASVPSMPDMTVDVFSSAQSYTVHAAVPGLDKKDIKITVDDGVLTIEAERREETRHRAPTQPAAAPSAEATASASSAEGKTPEQATTATAAAEGAASPAASAAPAAEVAQAEEDEGFQHVESFYGRVERSVQLPEDARLEELTAKYENGVIKIDVPRVQEQKRQARRIEIQ